MECFLFRLVGCSLLDFVFAEPAERGHFVTTPKAVVDGLAMGLGFTMALVILGGKRELIGQGTLFDGAHLMFGEAARGLRWSLSEDYPGILLAILPPGAFIGLGMMIALKNVIDNKLKIRSKIAMVEAATVSD